MAGEAGLEIEYGEKYLERAASFRGRPKDMRARLEDARLRLKRLAIQTELFPLPADLRDYVRESEFGRIETPAGEIEHLTIRTLIMDERSHDSLRFWNLLADLRKQLHDDPSSFHAMAMLFADIPVLRWELHIGAELPSGLPPKLVDALLKSDPETGRTLYWTNGPFHWFVVVDGREGERLDAYHAKLSERNHAEFLFLARYRSAADELFVDLEIENGEHLVERFRISPTPGRLIRWTSLLDVPEVEEGELAVGFLSFPEDLEYGKFSLWEDEEP